MKAKKNKRAFIQMENSHKRHKMSKNGVVGGAKGVRPPRPPALRDERSDPFGPSDDPIFRRNFVLFVLFVAILQSHAYPISTFRCVSHASNAMARCRSHTVHRTAG